jgi:hypothetical protein
VSVCVCVCVTERERERDNSDQGLHLFISSLGSDYKQTISCSSGVPW